MRRTGFWWRRRLISAAECVAIVVYVVAATCLGADFWTAIPVVVLVISVRCHTVRPAAETP